MSRSHSLAVLLSLFCCLALTVILLLSRALVFSFSRSRSGKPCPRSRRSISGKQSPSCSLSGNSHLPCPAPLPTLLVNVLAYRVRKVLSKPSSISKVPLLQEGIFQIVEVVAGKQENVFFKIDCKKAYSFVVMFVSTLCLVLFCFQVS